MATLSHTKSRRLYSWWWDSHISPKNSKWLHENLTDMDSKVKSMIKIIEEDADSFRKRAEMYYRKRPELLKLVEEFYRAYRALAERYDNATGALRVAQKTISEAFPDQIPFFPDEPPPEFSFLEFEKDGAFSDENDSVVSATGEIFAHDDRHEEVDALKDSISKLESENEALQIQCKNLNDEMLVGLAKLQRVEQQCEQLQKENVAKQMEIERFNGENHSLNDEIKLLEESKVKLENELGIHVVDKKSLQQEIWYLKAERRDLEQRHYELKDQIGLVNLNVESLQEMVKDLREGTVELKELCKKHEDERSLHLENLKFVENVTEQNTILQNSLKSANDELEILREKIRTLEENCDDLCGKISKHASEKSVLVSHIEAIAKNMEKLLEKNNLLENSLSDAHFELEDLRGKIKLLEESCLLFYDENSSLLGEKNLLLAQVKNISQNLEILESRHAELEVKNVELEKEKHCILHQVQALQSSLMLEKEEHNALRVSCKNQLTTLEDQLEDEYGTIVKFEVENFILQQSLHNMKENNTLLSNKCRKYMEIFKFQEQLISELKHEIHVQKKMLKWVSQYNAKLVESTHQVMKALNIDNESKSMDDIEFKLILDEIEKLKYSVLDAQDENQSLVLEKEVILTLFEQNLQSRFKELLALQSENNYLLEAKEQREEVLNTQMEILRKKLLELQEAHSMLLNDTSSLVNENLSFSKRVNELTVENEMLEENNSSLEAANLYFEYMNLIYKSYIDEAKEARDELQRNNLKLLENNTHITNSLAILQQINDKLCGEVQEHKMRENSLASELEYATQEIRNLQNENHIIVIDAAIFEEKMLELLMMCENLKVTSMVEKEMLYQEIQKQISNEAKFKCEYDTLDGEHRLLKEELSTYMPIVVSLSDSIASLEGQISSLVDHHSTSDHEKMANFEEGKEGHQPTMKSGVFKLRNLQSRIKMLEETVISIRSRLENHEFVPKSKSDDATTENEEPVCKDIILHPRNKVETDNDCNNNADTGKFEPLMKDIQLDHVLISSIYERGSSSYSSSAIGSDEIKDIWGDKITEYDHESSENITERLSSDAQRISSVQTNAKGLIESIETYEMSNKLVDFELEKVKSQLKEVQKAIYLEVDINSKLRKKVEQNVEKGKIHGKKIMLQIQKRSAKIGKLELELQKAEYVWLKLKEENDYKKARDAERRTKVLLRDYFYGTRESIRRKKEISDEIT